MTDEVSTDFCQLWDTERRTLAERASHVPDGGTIVEIGTAQGGSAYVFYQATASRGIKVYSYDIAPSAQAYERLRNTNVTIIAKPSVQGAAEWKKTSGAPIDLLFIDGSHALQDVFVDFNSWVTLLKDGATVIFHDFDSVERGGLVHFGSYIVLEALLRCKLLQAPVHSDRLLYGVLHEPGAIHLDIAECQATLLEIGQRITRLRQTTYTGWSIIGDVDFIRLLTGCLEIEGKVTQLSSPEAAKTGDKCLVISRPLESTLNKLKALNIESGSIISIDNLQLCYILAAALRTNRNYLLEICQSSKEFFRWEEILFMLEHAYGPFIFPDDTGHALSKKDPVQLSQFVAGEQVRLTILSRLLETFFTGWKP